MNPTANAQMDLLAWAQELEDERRKVESINTQRAARRGFLVIATDPAVDTDSPHYREVFATEAKTPNQAVAKVRPLADGRRLRAYLATGTYKHELADARWVA
jgi:hypothetical protein